MTDRALTELEIEAAATDLRAWLAAYMGTEDLRDARDPCLRSDRARRTPYRARAGGSAWPARTFASFGWASHALP